MRKAQTPFSRFVVTMTVVALACGTSLGAQARGAKVDPLSGTWTGELTAGERNRSIVLVLKFDGKTKVTGTFTGMPNPADVKSGTFDPKTGALKLDLGIAGDSAVRLTFEGTVAKDKASGRVSGEASGEFKLSKTDKPK
jgi:hypothetical protein